jgi:hypothetical protein
MIKHKDPESVSKNLYPSPERCKDAQAFTERAGH